MTAEKLLTFAHEGQRKQIMNVKIQNTESKLSSIFIKLSKYMNPRSSFCLDFQMFEFNIKVVASSVLVKWLSGKEKNKAEQTSPSSPSHKKTSPHL